MGHSGNQRDQAELVQFHLLISGRVQGVGFRKFVEKKAAALRGSVKGYVCNLKDGRVEVRICGIPEGVEQMIAWCKKGPLLSRVDSVEIHAEAPDLTFEGFVIRQ